MATPIKRGRHEATPIPGLPRSKDEIARDPQPGDIYYTSWGYDQTNSEFYEVTRRTPGTVTVVRINGRLGDPEHGEQSNRIYPSPGDPVTGLLALEKVCRLQTTHRKWESEDSEIIPGARLNIDQSRTAWPYSGGGQYTTAAAGLPGH